MQARVRHPQTRHIDHRIAVQQQVQVQRARAPTLTGDAMAAELGFHRQQQVQQRARCQRRVHERHGVDEVGLVLPAPRRRAVEARHRAQRHTAMHGQRLDGSSQGTDGIAQIGAQANGGPDGGRHSGDAAVLR